MRLVHRALAALALGGALLAPVLAAPPSVSQAAVKLRIHPAPLRGRARLPHAASTDPITFHGGSVMTGPVRVYVVWYGGWSRTSRRRALVKEYLQHLASPYWNINRAFTSATGKSVTDFPVLAGETDDADSVGLQQLSDDEIQQVVQRAVSTKALPRDSHGIYLVLTSSKVTKAGFLTEYCGWHSYAHINRAILKFAFIGDPTGPRIGGCSPQTGSPNRDAGADSMVSTIAHELSETVTDPTFNGWRTDKGEENADRCAWQYGPLYDAGGGKANVRLGTRDYLIQTNWVLGVAPHCGMVP